MSIIMAINLTIKGNKVTIFEAVLQFLVPLKTLICSLSASSKQSETDNCLTLRGNKVLHQQEQKNICWWKSPKTVVR